MARCGCGSSAVCTCLVTAGDNVTVTGSGSAGSPYVISAALTIDCDDVRPCLSAGPGIIYDVATGVISAEAPDCEVVRACFTAGTGVISAGPIDCDDVRGCLSAGLGIDYDATTGVISAEALDCDVVRGCFTAGTGIDPTALTTGVIQALVSTDAGNTLTIGADNGLFTPAAAAAPAEVACGLTGTGVLGDPLAVNTGGAAWPYVCDEAANGAPIYCGADGVVRTNPPIQVDASLFSDELFFPDVATPAAITTIVTTAAPGPALNNCTQQMRVTEVEVDVDFNMPANSSAQVAINGDVMLRVLNTTATPWVDYHVQVTKVFPVVDATGAPPTPGAINIGVAGAGGTTYNRVQWFVRHSAISSHEA